MTAWPRPIQTVSKEEDNGTSIVSATYYDEVGREEAAWIPYRKSTFSFDPNPGQIGGSWGTAQSYHNDNNPYTLTKYKNDPLDRIDEIQLPDDNVFRATEYDYGTGWLTSNHYNWTRVEDPNNKKTTTYTDTFGNTKRIILPKEDIGPTATRDAITDFTYDSLGRLIQVSNLDYNEDLDDQTITYTYDTRGFMTSKSTPDASGDADNDPTNEPGNGVLDYEYRYDKSGNLRFVRDPNRRASTAAYFGYYLYKKYDGHNRLIEEGIRTNSTGFDSEVDNASFPTSSITKKATYSYVGGQQNIVTFYDKDGNSSTYDYDYDNRGRISKITINLHGLSVKTIEYDYDLQGQVIHSVFKNGGADEFHHWYNYDNVGRLLTVEVGTNSNVSTRAATYTYFENGQVQKLELGPINAPVQTINYTYNLKGWLTKINDPEDLLGDAFGLRLSYNSTPDWLTDANDSNLASLFVPTNNRNIAAALWSTNVNGQSGGEKMGYLYSYDGLNRLIKAENLQNSNPFDRFDWDNFDSFDVPSITYDDVGNILSLTRKDENGSGNGSTYTYSNNSNRLSTIAGKINSTYTYDNNGNMTGGTVNGLSTTLSYDYRNLPETITAGGMTFTYNYDANGQRTYSSFQDTYYIRGAVGEIVAVYHDHDGDNIHELSHWNMLAGPAVIGRRTQ